MRLWLYLRSRSLVTTSLVVAELATHLHRLGVDGGSIAQRLRIICESPAIDIIRHNRHDELEALRLIENFADPQLGFVDAVSFAVMRRLDLNEAFTYDRHFDLLGFSRLPLTRP